MIREAIYLLIVTCLMVAVTIIPDDPLTYEVSQ